MKIVRVADKFYKSIRDMFKKEVFFTIISNRYKGEYWVVNKEGDLVFRNSSYGECLRFIKMNTRK